MEKYSMKLTFKDKIIKTFREQPQSVKPSAGSSGRLSLCEQASHTHRKQPWLAHRIRLRKRTRFLVTGGLAPLLVANLHCQKVHPHV